MSSKIVNIMGMKVDLELVENPILKKILENLKCLNCYTEHSRFGYSDTYSKYGDHSKYSEYREHNDESYSERYDAYNGWPGSHRDIHTDEIVSKPKRRWF